MAAYHEGKTRPARGRSAKSAWLPPTPGLRDWRAQMAGRDVELFEALAGDLLSSLGYERAAPTASPGTAALARACLRWWEAESARREKGPRHPDPAAPPADGAGTCPTRQGGCDALPR